MKKRKYRKLMSRKERIEMAKVLGLILWSVFLIIIFLMGITGGDL